MAWVPIITCPEGHHPVSSWVRMSDCTYRSSSARLMMLCSAKSER